MNIFVLCTGRCGSTAFNKACQHITNYTSTHESKDHRGRIGTWRFDFPDNHIEVDFRLAWQLGRLDRAWGDKALYVHLTRDSEAVAKSYARLAQIERKSSGFMSKMFELPEFVNRPGSPVWAHMHLQTLKTAPIEVVAADMVDAVNANIGCFLKDKRWISVRMENIEEDFTAFWNDIGAKGDLEAALAEFGKGHNTIEELLQESTDKEKDGMKKVVNMEFKPKEFFGPYLPASSGTDEAIVASSMKTIKSVFPSLIVLIKSQGIPVCNVTDINMFMPDALSVADQLKESFDFFGSDKSKSHNYQHVYGRILSDLNAPYKIFEIGLGSTNENILSNMGGGGNPGASLRAFKARYPNAEIYGADIDREILFEDDRIKTFWLDQTEPFTFRTLEVPDGLDLAIDDGLHAPDANLNSLTYMLPKVKVGGYVVIEDVSPLSVPIWEIVSSLIGRLHSCWIIKDGVNFLFVVRREI